MPEGNASAKRRGEEYKRYVQIHTGKPTITDRTEEEEEKAERGRREQKYKKEEEKGWVLATPAYSR